MNQRKLLSLAGILIFHLVLLLSLAALVEWLIWAQAETGAMPVSLGDPYGLTANEWHLIRLQLPVLWGLALITNLTGFQAQVSARSKTGYLMLSMALALYAVFAWFCVDRMDFWNQPEQAKLQLVYLGALTIVTASILRPLRRALRP